MSFPCCAGLSDRGRVRESNEDRWSADTELGLFAVSDGMGGLPAGEMAAEIAIATLPTLITTHFGAAPDLTAPEAAQRLSTVLAELSADVRAGSQDDSRRTGMGATVVVALMDQGTALIAHLGDSRAYLWRENSLQRLTRDHSLAQGLLDSGVISEQEAAEHPARHQLAYYLGMEGEAISDVRHVTLHPADRLLLCSDGLTNMLDDARILQILNDHSDPDAACRALVGAANDAGGTDNITALVVVHTA
ncbi:MAG: PP2C family protein-serine/threonine phosphatase [Pseudonocardiaceae bacterium]